MSDDNTLRLVLDQLTTLTKDIANLRDDIHQMQLGGINAQRDAEANEKRITAIERVLDSHARQLEDLAPVAETYVEFRKKFVTGIATVILLGLCFAGYVVWNLTAVKLNLQQPTAVQTK